MTWLLPVYFGAFRVYASMGSKKWRVQCIGERTDRGYNWGTLGGPEAWGKVVEHVTRR